MKIAVVILNWNGIKFLQQFLRNVVAHSSDLAHVYVADNGSTDVSVEYVRSHHPEVQIIETGGNFGYAGGYNRALAQIKEPYAVLLNSDVQVDSGWLQPLLDVMEHDENVAACQPKVLDFNNKVKFEYAGASGGFLDPWGFPFCRGRIFDALEHDNGQYQSVMPIFWATGACMFVRMKAFREVGGLDADFFAHMEEIDLCWRFQRAGHTIYVAPESTVYHVGGGTLSKSNPRKTFLNFRNGLELLLKNLPPNQLVQKLGVRIVLDWLAAWRFLFAGNGKDFLAVFKAHLAFYGRFNSTIKKRGGAYPKLSGMHSRSIVLDYFLRKKKTFSSLWLE